MKTFYMFFLLLFSFSAISAQVIIDGHAFLQNQPVHENIKVLFERTAPSTLLDSVFTDSSGYYQKTIPTGVYDVHFSKSNYLPVDLTGQVFYSNVTLQDTTLEFAGLLNGPISGILTKNTYTINTDIEVATGDTLIINPGVKLLFKQGVNFNINGLLIAMGEPNDSIVFTRFASGITWGGINFNNSANDNSIISYCVIEYSNSSGIELNYSSPTLKNSTVRNNSASSGGGGINCYYSNSTITNIFIYNNNAGWGGGVSCSNSNPIFNNLIVSNNTGTFCGGINLMSTSSPIIQNSVFYYNYGQWNAGGILCHDNSSPVITNIIFSDNINYAVACTSSAATPDISYSCFWNNTPADINKSGTDACNISSWVGVNVTVNNIGDSCDPWNNIKADPLFVNASNSDFHLQSTSPCIDAGTYTAVTAQTDFDGNIRIWDGNGDGDTIVDMGAYEYNSIILSLNHLIGDDDCPIAYPNPATGKFTLKMPIIEGYPLLIEITDIYGIPVYKKQIIHCSMTEQIDLSDCTKGIYIIKVIFGIRTTLKKIILL